MSQIMAALGLAQAEEFEPKVVTAKVVSATADVALLRTATVGKRKGQDLVLPVTEWYPNVAWNVDDVVQVLQLDHGPRALASAARDELVEALFAGVSPEVRSGAVRIMGVARAVGVRCKVAVAATETGVDPKAALIGRNANRVKTVSAALCNERIEIVAWHPEPAEYLRSALAPAEVTEVTIEDGKAVAKAPHHLMSAAVGGSGLNSQLAGQLVGVQVTIVPA
jgi:transcription antitermination factor NusA-like protein